jgi:hypothetical protein
MAADDVDDDDARREGDGESDQDRAAGRHPQRKGRAGDDGGGEDDLDRCRPGQAAAPQVVLGDVDADLEEEEDHADVGEQLGWSWLATGPGVKGETTSPAAR